MSKSINPGAKVSRNTIFVIFDISIERINVIVRNKFVQDDSKLTDIIDTLNSLRLTFGLRKHRQQKRCENPDDGDNDQEFNQLNAD